MKNETGNYNAVVPHNQAPAPPPPQSSVRRMTIEIHFPPQEAVQIVEASIGAGGQTSTRGRIGEGACEEGEDAKGKGD